MNVRGKTRTKECSVAGAGRGEAMVPKAIVSARSIRSRIVFAMGEE